MDRAMNCDVCRPTINGPPAACNPLCLLLELLLVVLKRLLAEQDIHILAAWTVWSQVSPVRPQCILGTFTPFASRWNWRVTGSYHGAIKLPQTHSVHSRLWHTDTVLFFGPYIWQPCCSLYSGSTVSQRPIRYGNVQCFTTDPLWFPCPSVPQAKQRRDSWSRAVQWQLLRQWFSSWKSQNRTVVSCDGNAHFCPVGWSTYRSCFLLTAQCVSKLKPGLEETNHNNPNGSCALWLPGLNLSSQQQWLACAHSSHLEE